MDEPVFPINETMYMGIIGSFLYLTARRPDIVFSIGLYARFQSSPKESHLKAAKRILRLEPQPSPTKAQISNQLPSTVSSPTPSGSGPHCTRKSQNPKTFVISPSPSATTEKVKSEGPTSTYRFLQTTEEIVEGDE
nr:uncharacterized protein LOC104095463 [Nicotiana tomentosiformis]